jgi:hypothetical protein
MTRAVQKTRGTQAPAQTYKGDAQCIVISSSGSQRNSRKIAKYTSSQKLVYPKVVQHSNCATLITQRWYCAAAQKKTTSIAHFYLTFLSAYGENTTSVLNQKQREVLRDALSSLIRQLYI